MLFGVLIKVTVFHNKFYNVLLRFNTFQRKLPKNIVITLNKDNGNGKYSKKIF